MEKSFTCLTKIAAVFIMLYLALPFASKAADKGYGAARPGFAIPVVNVQPADAVTCAGSNTVTFSVVATGATSYQWQAKAPYGDYVSVGNGDFYSNASTANLTVTNPILAMINYQYRVILSNADGSTTSAAATLTV